MTTLHDLDALAAVVGKMTPGEWQSDAGDPDAAGINALVTAWPALLAWARVGLAFAESVDATDYHKAASDDSLAYDRRTLRVLHAQRDLSDALALARGAKGTP